jgi:hypothetical protein
LVGNEKWPSGTWIEKVQIKKQWCTYEKNDSAQGCRDLEGFKDNYMEHKKLKHICTGVHDRSDA